MTKQELLKENEKLKIELEAYKEIIKGFQIEYSQLVYLLARKDKNDKNGKMGYKKSQNRKRK